MSAWGDELRRKADELADEAESLRHDADTLEQRAHSLYRQADEFDLAANLSAPEGDEEWAALIAARRDPRQLPFAFVSGRA